MSDFFQEKTISLPTLVIVEGEYELNKQKIGSEITFAPEYNVFTNYINFLSFFAQEYDVNTFFKGRLKYAKKMQDNVHQGETSKKIEFVDITGNKDKNFYKRHCIVFESDPANEYILDIEGNQITVAYGINKIRCSLNEQGEITLAKKIKTSIVNGKKIESVEDGEIDPNEVIPNLKLIREIANVCNRYHREKENNGQDR